MHWVPSSCIRKISNNSSRQSPACPVPCAPQQPTHNLAVRHWAVLLLRSGENAREGRSQGFDPDFSQQESASENKFGFTSTPLTKRLQAWVREENKVQPCLCTTMCSRGMESDYVFVCLWCSLWSCIQKKGFPVSSRLPLWAEKIVTWLMTAETENTC